MSGGRRTWLVEISRDQFQTIRSERLWVDGGSLIFARFDGMHGEIVELAFAPGQWLTVTEDES